MQTFREVMQNVKTTLIWQKLSKADNMFYFLAIWTITQFAMCVVEFVKVNTFRIPEEMPFVYFLLILIYALRKEVDRWLKKTRKARKGELFVLGWWFAMLVMFIIEFRSLGFYTVPDRMIQTCIWVLLPYAATSISKIIHHQAEKEKAAKNDNKR